MSKKRRPSTIDGSTGHVISQSAEPLAIEKFAKLLDSRFVIPGTNIRFGADSVIGLVPFVGDAASMVMGLAIVGGAWQAGAQKKTLVKMLANVGLDTVIGSVPVVGDGFDLLWRSNDRNMKLLRKDLGLDEPEVMPLSSEESWQAEMQTDSTTGNSTKQKAAMVLLALCSVVALIYLINQ